MRTWTGRRVLANRRRKGRKQLTPKEISLENKPKARSGAFCVL
jgi:hypothetical protein